MQQAGERRRTSRPGGRALAGCGELPALVSTRGARFKLAECVRLFDSYGAVGGSASVRVATNKGAASVLLAIA